MARIMSRFGLVRVMVLMVALVTIVLGGTGTASAATLVISSGVVGNHAVNDMPWQAGATCVYRPVGAHGREIVAVWAQAPVMYARNRTSGVDQQVVSYSANLYWRNGATGYVSPLVYGPTRTATATDATPATLSRTEFSVTPPSYQSGSLLVAVTLLWYSPSTGAIEGRRDYIIDYYNLAVTRPQLAPLREATVYGSCADARTV